jgi:hypothetical protein
MGIHSKGIGWAPVLSAAALAFATVSCNNTIATSPEYLSVTISPRSAVVPVGTSVVFTGTSSNNLSLPQWTILDSAESANPGTLSAIAGSPDSILYTAPATPPTYTVTPTGVTQGSATLVASVNDPPGTSIPTTSDSVTFVVTAPAVTLSLAPLAATVGLGATQQFIGYAVGNVDNALTWQIDGVTGGSSSLGTINTAGTYVAPAAMPMSGNTVTLTILSQADPTKTLSATITLH